VSVRVTFHSRRGKSLREGLGKFYTYTFLFTGVCCRGSGHRIILIKERNERDGFVGRLKRRLYSGAEGKRGKTANGEAGEALINFDGVLTHLP